MHEVSDRPAGPFVPVVAVDDARALSRATSVGRVARGGGRTGGEVPSEPVGRGERRGRSRGPGLAAFLSESRSPEVHLCVPAPPFGLTGPRSRVFVRGVCVGPSCANSPGPGPVRPPPRPTN